MRKRCADNRFFRNGAAGQLPDDPPAGKDQHAIGSEQLGIFGGAPDEGPSLPSYFGADLIEVALGNDVDTARRIIKEEERGIGCKCPSHQSLLLVAAAELPDVRLKPADVQLEAGGGSNRRSPLERFGNHAERPPSGDPPDADIGEHVPEREY